METTKLEVRHLLIDCLEPMKGSGYGCVDQDGNPIFIPFKDSEILVNDGLLDKADHDEDYQRIQRRQEVYNESK